MAEPDPSLERYGERRHTPRWPRRLRLALASALALGLGGLAIAIVAHRDGGWRPPSGLGGFRACTHGDRVPSRCIGVLAPVDPSRPTGRSIALRVAVIPATRQPARGALFYLEGGPGQAANDVAVSVSEIFAKVSEYRDIVLVDQRGTGGSRRLACPQEHVRAVDGGAVSAYLRRCFASLGGEARLLTTAVAAEDLERVRRALGYGRIDVYGSSYGATLGQLFLRRHPRSVRSLTLDGGSLPSVPVYELAPRNAERALQLLIARCQAQPPCRRAYPDTRAELESVLEQRARGSGDRLATAVAVLLRKPEDAARVPLVVHAAARGEDAPLEREYREHVGSELDARSRLAMFWMILCGESWARFDPSATARESTGSYLAPAGIARAAFFRQACASVPGSAGPAEPAGAWSSRAPVLLLAGDADPQDPPANLRGWRDIFPNGRLITVPGLAHGTIAYGCLRLVVARFIAAGTARGLDARCALQVPLPPFELT